LTSWRRWQDKRASGAPNETKNPHVTRMADPAGPGLDEYLRGEYSTARRSIQDTRELLNEVLRVFARTFDAPRKTWPYQFVNGVDPTRPFYSFSTTAMIAFALGLETGRIARSVLVPAVEPDPRLLPDTLRQQLDQCLNKALAGFVEQSRLLAGEYRNKSSLPHPDAPPEVYSATFGWDDPFTLTWLIELMTGESENGVVMLRRALARSAKRRLASVAKAPDPIVDVLNVFPDERVANAFPLLRLLQLGETLSRPKHVSRVRNLHSVEEILRLRVHEHLSDAEIPDSGFDASDLVFSLEAWILSNPVEPDRRVIDRVFELIRRSQEATPYWRALRPFKVTQAGLALLPQSVEVANSLLRICEWPALRAYDYFGRQRDLFERYAQWLVARVFRGFTSKTPKETTSFVGWESEHTYTLNRIHLWQTSQAVIFLRHYTALLERHIERESLRLAGFPQELITSIPSPKPSSTSWRNFVKTEPLAALAPESAYRTYRRIDEAFITPRQIKSGEPAFSMLLYGPPGTGKSTIAARVAQTLGFRFITVTPSDFIAGGGEEVEARAKAIFTVLHGQTNLLVLFDEIDHLLLDRDSGLYRRQEDLFQLLTPGMLTKLNDLAKAKRVLFVVATNYYEHIDRAIKRPGRIDARYLVLPPGRSQRRAFLARTPNWASIPTELTGRMVADTVQFTYRELTDLMAFVERRNPGARGGRLARGLLEAVEQLPPIIKLEGYRPRLGYAEGSTAFGDVDSVDRPWEEFAMLAYLELEARGSLPEAQWVRLAVREALRQKAVLDPAVASRLDRATHLKRRASR